MDIQGGNRFFFNFKDKRGFLSEEESHHLVNVLRKKEGEKILLINGKGKEYEGKILEIIKSGKKVKAKVEINKIIREENPPSKEIIAFIPLLKGNKTEFLVEKGIELGITTFIPFYSDYSIVKPKSNLFRRLHLKAVSALKQSGRLIFPKIYEPICLKEFLQNFPFKNSLNLLALPKGKISLLDLKENILKYKQIIFISGPEGGFSADEIELLSKQGFLSINLSPFILRAETASLTLMCLVTVLLFHLDKF